MCILIASIICYATDGARYGRSGVASETAIGFGISNIFSTFFPSHDRLRMDSHAIRSWRLLRLLS